MKPALIGLLLWASVALSAKAQTVGTCSPAMAEAYLDVGNVRARILNNGNLFYSGEPHVYNVPKGSISNALFMSALWIGGMSRDTLRFSGATYRPAEFWPGPLDDSGYPPADCAEYDRLFKISRIDVATYEATGVAAPDLVDWPTGLGAPTLDASGQLIEWSGEPLASRKDRRINLAAGERPEFLGDQMIWWVMNDRGNARGGYGSLAPAVGVEVHGLAFAFDEPGDLGNATFYKYSILSRSSSTVTDAYLGFFSDPDLGDAGDDWVGSDSLLGLGYVLNSDNNDVSGEGYDTPPPAVGHDLLQGPLVPSPGSLARVGNREFPGFRSLGATSVFAFFDEEASNGAQVRYNAQRALWWDGRPLTYGSDGRSLTAARTGFAFSGDASLCGYWSECNTGGLFNNSGGDRRFAVSAGPFVLSTGARQEVLLGIVYARGRDHLQSVAELKLADESIQSFFDSGFTEWPAMPMAPIEVPELISPADGVAGQPPRLELNWSCTQDALYCEMQVDDDATFASPEAHSTSEAVEAGLVADRAYWWRARGVGRGEVPGPWSPVRSFHTGNTVFEYPITDFHTVANAAGPIIPPDCGAFSFNGSGFPLVECGSDRPSTHQQAGSVQQWGLHAGGALIPFGPISSPTSYLGRTWGTREATGSVSAFLPFDYEWRFTAAGGKARRAYDGGDVIDVPFELWRTGIGTPDDPSDDVRLIPVVCEQACGAGTMPNRFDAGKDHGISGGANDPATDWVDWLLPDDTSPGQAGYEAYFAGTGGAREIMARQVLVCLNCGLAAPYPQEHPEIGTVFRIVTGVPDAAILSAPSDGASVPADAVRLYWHGSPDLLPRVEVASEPSFAAPEVQRDRVAAGITIESLHPGTWWWRVGSDEIGWSEAWSLNVLPATAVETPGELPTEFALEAIWPNPFNPLATIRFGLPADAIATIDVVDVLGRRVAVIDAGARRSAGWHTVQFDGSRLASGVYFVRLAAGGRLDVKSVVLLK